MNKKLLGILLLTVMCRVAFAQTDELMNRAIKEYLRGDYIGAIQDFERVLEMEKNEKARNLLYKSVVEEGKRRLNGGELESAKQYLERAKEINPDDREMVDLLSEVNKKLGSRTKTKIESKAAVDLLQQQVKKIRTEKNTYRSRVNSLTSQRDKFKKDFQANKKKLQESQAEIEQLADTARKKQKSLNLLVYLGGAIFVVFGVVFVIVLIRVYSASNASQYQLEELQEKFSERMKEAETESSELEERVARSINKMIDGQKDVIKQVSLSATGKTQTDIEEIKDRLESHFETQENKLIELLNQQVRAISTEKTEKIELPDRVITDINPHVRARADSVEMIPKTVSDPKVAEKMLRPYLGDQNNRVRANACVAIYRYNPELAIETLRKMASSSDKWMRLSTAWAVGEIASPDGVHILRKLLDDVDERVKDRAVKAFESMAEVKTNVAEDIRRMIEENKKPEEE